MGVIDATSLTLSPEEAKSVSEIIQQRVYNDPELTELCSIETGIGAKEQIVLSGNMGLVGKTSRGCTPQVDTAAIVFSERYWDPKEVDFKIKHCKNDLPALFKAFRRKMKASESYDLEGSEELQFIESRAEAAMAEAVKRLAWFGKTDIENVADGGTLKDGISLDYFNTIDGIWEQITQYVGFNRVTRVVIPENAGVTYAEQDALDNQRALSVLKSLYKSADPRLIDAPGAYFAITGSLYYNLQDLLEEKSLNFSVTDLQKDNGQLSYRGIPIKAAKFWDRFIASYFNDGVRKNLPHRAVLTVKENIPVGTMDENSMKDFNSWYNKDDRNNYLEGIWTIDAKLLEDYMIAVAY